MLDLGHLNPPQREAVLYGDGPLVVFAGAGSGKTGVITHRVADLIVRRDIAPWRVLSVTFTNKAAAEMRERLSVLVPGGIRDMRVGTFHATCARLLRRYAEQVGIKKDFTIYDDQDQRAMVKRVLKAMELDEKRFPAKQVAGAINRAKQEVTGPEDMAADDPWHEVVRRVYHGYEEAMTRSGALDFGDLIYRFTRALEANDELRAHLAGRFRHILVDEFQDTNHAQLRLVQALASVHRNLCVVGDDDQSIYRWRGADRRNILDFKKSFPDAHVIKLEQNYRSTKRILRVSNAVIRRNREREPKELWTANVDGEKVLVLRAADEREEAMAVLELLRQTLDQGQSLEDVAVFYRIHAQSRVLEEMLRASNMPYRIVGGQRFYDRAEVKDVLAYLRVLHNPEDDVSVLRIINTPGRGIGKTSTDRLIDVAARRGCGVWEAIGHVEDEAVFKGAAKKRIGGFKKLIDELMERARTTEGLEDLGAAILHDTGYLDMLNADDTPESDARRENLQELLGSMGEFAPVDDDESPLAAFLERVTLETQADDLDADQRVTLMTVHAAKGLEFPTVMVTGLEEQMFPFRGHEAWADGEELEEERRLAYVAFTRAKQRLILCYAGVRRLFGQARVNMPSRFLDEMPAADVQWIGGTPSRGRRGPARGSSGGARRARSQAPSAGAAGEAGGYSGGFGGAQRGAPPPRAGADFDGVDVDPSSSGSSAAAASGESYVDTSEGDHHDGGGAQEGMRVRHKKFGVGEVREVRAGALRVFFPGWGVKTVVPSYLEPV